MQQEHKLPNNRHQYSENPHRVHKAHLHNLTAGTWCAVTTEKIIEIAILKTVHSGHYVKLILTPILQEINNRGNPLPSKYCRHFV